MTSLLEKTQTLIQANMHDIVDRALEANSVAVMKQYIRDAEDNLDELEDATAAVGGEVLTLKRNYQNYKKGGDELDRNIDLLLMQGKADLAASAQTKLNSTRRLQEQYHEQWISQQKEHETLKSARLKLEAKVQIAREELKEMESLLKLAESKEITVKTIKSLDDLQGVSDSDIARLRDSISRRLDKADAYSELYADRLDSQMDEALGRAEVDLQLEERKRRLGLTEEPPVVEEKAEEEEASSIE